MDTAMDLVIIDPPASVLAERERLGLDGRDEVWDGEYHMVPAANNEHQRLELELALALHPIVVAAGLELRVEVGLYAPLSTGLHNFRVPDLVVYRPGIGSARGVEGAASLVIEIRSPGDESFDKLRHYEQFGVDEVVIIDRDTKAVRRWVRIDDVLEELEGDPAGQHHLTSVPVALAADHGTLVVITAATTTRI